MTGQRSTVGKSALRLVIAGAMIAVSCACGRSNSVPNGQPLGALSHRNSSSDPIQHIVLIVQENRTFNNLFATFPNALGTTTGLERVGAGKKARTVSINLSEIHLAKDKDPSHVYAAYKLAYRDGNMDAFNLIRSPEDGRKEGALPYEYVYPSDVQPYWTLATDYALADHLFQTQGSGSFVAHQDLIRGGTEINSSESLVDDPTSQQVWGCTAPPGSVTSLITTGLKYERDAGPYPCTNQFPPSGTYETLADLLDAKSVSWKYYTPKTQKGSVGAMWNAYFVIYSVFGNQTEWNAHISSPSANILTDVAKGALPAMSWVIPDAKDSDHPGYASDYGPSWVASIVNAIGQSPYWDSTAVIVVWDDWGGFYDEVAPPPLDEQGGPGFRVGMIVASPYVPANEISHTTYEFGSIIRFIEDTWSLGRLRTTDKTSTSIADMFDFNQPARAYKPVRAKYSRSFFLHQKPSGLPVDKE